MVWLLSLTQNTFPFPSSVEAAGGSGLANMGGQAAGSLCRLHLQHQIPPFSSTGLCGGSAAGCPVSPPRAGTDRHCSPSLYGNIQHIQTRPSVAGFQPWREEWAAVSIPLPSQSRSRLGEKGRRTLRSPLPMSSRERSQMAGAGVGAEGVSSSRTVS